MVFLPMALKLPLIFILLLAGCNATVKHPTTVYFGGEIVNPTDRYVVLYKGDSIIDSAKLDPNNRFGFHLDHLKNGLYHFKHAPEHQYVFLEEGDSLIVRLNTVDFDESLIFSGQGEEKNNFLLNLFLTEEEERKDLRKFYTYEPLEFKEKILQLRQNRLDDLARMQGAVPLSPKAVALAKASIDYAYYTYLEKYPFKHPGTSRRQNISDLPTDFYDYRKTVDFNNTDITYLRPYYNFMVNYFGNLTYVTCLDDCADENEERKDLLHYNQHKLHLIDSIVPGNELRDNLFRHVAFDYLLKAQDSPEDNAKFISDFHKVSGDNKHIADVDDLYNGIQNIQPNNMIPDVYVINDLGDSVSLREIAKNRKTVFYFWSGSEKRHFNNITKRVTELERTQPDYTFVGIGLKVEDQEWRNMLHSAGFDENGQYRAPNLEALSKALIIYPKDKCIVTDNAKIVDAFSSIYSAF